MREGKKVNGFVFGVSSTLNNLFVRRYIFGFSKKIKSIILGRLEVQSARKISDLRFSKNIAFFKTLLNVFPQQNDLKRKHVINIFMLDLINSYRGFRHAMGLPTRGQRTWSNAWSAYRSNTLLRQFKIKLSKRMYSSISLSDLNVAYLAEQINNLWRLQWEEEWKFSRKQRQGQTKKSKTFFNVDLKMIASANINLKKKKKNYLVGFDSGFTKFVFKHSGKQQIQKKKHKFL